MKILIKFLIWSIKTIDGKRDSAKECLDNVCSRSGMINDLFQKSILVSKMFVNIHYYSNRMVRHSVLEESAILALLPFAAMPPEVVLAVVHMRYLN